MICNCFQVWDLQIWTLPFANVSLLWPMTIPTVDPACCPLPSLFLVPGPHYWPQLNPPGAWVPFTVPVHGIGFSTADSYSVQRTTVQANRRSGCRQGALPLWVPSCTSSHSALSTPARAVLPSASCGHWLFKGPPHFAYNSHRSPVSHFPAAGFESPATSSDPLGSRTGKDKERMACGKTCTGKHQQLNPPPPRTDSY